MNKIDDLLKNIDQAQAATMRQHDALEQRRTWLLNHKELVESMEAQCDITYWFCIDFHNPGRDDVHTLLKACGRLEKEYNSERLMYIGCVDGMEVRLYNAELPPSCQLVEEEVVIPEHVELRRKIVCNETDPQP